MKSLTNSIFEPLLRSYLETSKIQSVESLLKFIFDPDPKNLIGFYILKYTVTIDSVV
jgi:hypothetical protein